MSLFSGQVTALLSIYYLTIEFKPAIAYNIILVIELFGGH